MIKPHEKKESNEMNRKLIERKIDGSRKRKIEKVFSVQEKIYRNIM